HGRALAEPAHFASRGHVPDVDRRLRGGGDQQPAVAGEGESVSPAGGPDQAAEFLARGRVPQVDRPLVTSRGQEPAVPREGDPDPLVLGFTDPAHLSAGSDFPEPRHRLRYRKALLLLDGPDKLTNHEPTVGRE